jgi:hypothetical protein
VAGPIRATERIYRDRPGGGRELAYNVGAEVSEEDAIALGLTDKPDESEKADKPEDEKADATTEEPKARKRPTRDKQVSKQAGRRAKK